MENQQLMNLVVVVVEMTRVAVVAMATEMVYVVVVVVAITTEMTCVAAVAVDSIASSVPHLHDVSCSSCCVSMSIRIARQESARCAAVHITAARRYSTETNRRELEPSRSRSWNIVVIMTEMMSVSVIDLSCVR